MLDLGPALWCASVLVPAAREQLRVAHACDATRATPSCVPGSCRAPVDEFPELGERFESCRSTRSCILPRGPRPSLSCRCAGRPTRRRALGHAGALTDTLERILDLVQPPLWREDCSAARESRRWDRVSAGRTRRAGEGARTSAGGRAYVRESYRLLMRDWRKCEARVSRQIGRASCRERVS